MELDSSAMEDWRAEYSSRVGKYAGTFSGVPFLVA